MRGAGELVREMFHELARALGELFCAFASKRARTKKLFPADMRVSSALLLLLTAPTAYPAYTPYAAKAIANAPTPAAAARLRLKYARKEACEVRQQLGAIRRSQL